MFEILSISDHIPTDPLVAFQAHAATRIKLVNRAMPDPRCRERKGKLGSDRCSSAPSVSGTEEVAWSRNAANTSHFNRQTIDPERLILNEVISLSKSLKSMKCLCCDQCLAWKILRFRLVPASQPLGSYDFNSIPTETGHESWWILHSPSNAIALVRDSLLLSFSGLDITIPLTFKKAPSGRVVSRHSGRHRSEATQGDRPFWPPIFSRF